jgi:hypothetical protein
VAACEGAIRPNYTKTDFISRKKKKEKFLPRNWQRDSQPAVESDDPKAGGELAKGGSSG